MAPVNILLCIHFVHNSDCDLSRGETFIDLFVVSLRTIWFLEFPFHFCVFFHSIFSSLFSCIADCVDPSCSGHGTCINGQCYCKFLHRFVISSETLNHFVVSHNGLTLESMCVCVFYPLHRQSWMAGRRLQHRWPTSLSVFARMLGAWHIRFRNWHMHLRTPLDWTRLFSRYLLRVNLIDNGGNIKWPKPFVKLKDLAQQKYFCCFFNRAKSHRIWYSFKI